MDVETNELTRVTPLMEVKGESVTLLMVNQDHEGVHVTLPNRPLSPLEFAKIATTMHLAVLHLKEVVE